LKLISLINEVTYDNQQLKKDIKYLKLMSKYFTPKSEYKDVQSYLVENLGLSKDRVLKLWYLFISNYKKNPEDYNNLTKLVYVGNPFYNFINNQKINGLDDIDDQFIGNYFKKRYNNISIERNNTILLTMSCEDWYNYWSGLSEDDQHWYMMALSSDRWEFYNEVSELIPNMGIYLTDEAILKLKELVELTLSSFYIFLCNNPNELRNNRNGEVYNMIKDVAGEPKANEISDIMINDINYELSDQGSTHTIEYFNENKKYGGSESCEMLLTLDNILEIITDNPEITSFSDMKEAHINGDGYELEGEYTDNYDMDIVRNVVSKEFIKNIDKILDDIDSNENYTDTKNNIDSILNGLGFKNFKLVKNGIEYIIIDVDINEYKIDLETIQGDRRRRYRINPDDLTNYVNSPLLFKESKYL